MNTKFNVGDRIIVEIEGIVKRISMDESEITYTIIANDGLGRSSYVYFDEKDLTNARRVGEE